VVTFDCRTFRRRRGSFVERAVKQQQIQVVCLQVRQRLATKQGEWGSEQKAQ
jgi:hypothetical protein